MKKLTVFAIFALGILAAGNALAQQQQVRANVPFSFTVGTKTLPAGVYTITSVSDGVLEIQNKARHVTVLTSAFDTAQKSDKGNVLVFEKHVGQYSLRDILCQSAALNLSLPVAHWKRGSYIEEAMNSPIEGTVTVPVN